MSPTFETKQDRANERAILQRISQHRPGITFQMTPRHHGFDAWMFVNGQRRGIAEIKKEYSAKVKHAILIGGGLVGLETGGALLRREVKVAVIEYNPRILPRQIDEAGAQILQKKMEAMGFSFFLNGQSDEILGKEKVEGLRLKDGRVVEGQMVILSAGVRPNIQLAKEMGLEMKNGILVDDQLKPKTEGIFAAGDVAEHRGRVYGIWPAAQRQGEVAGVNMAGGEAIYEGTHRRCKSPS